MGRRDVRLGHEWGEFRCLDYTDGNPEYLVAHETHKTATSEPGWFIWKLTFDTDGNLTRKQGPLVGIADDRATLSW